MRIDIKEAKPGDVILFKGNGLVFSIFSKLLSLLDPGWRKLDWKPWHMGLIFGKTLHGWIVAGGYSPVSRLHYYRDEELEGCRVYRRVVDNTKFDLWLDSHLNKPYDVTIYFWTTLQYLIRHYFNHRIPRLLNSRFTCWEFAEEWEMFNGSSWCDKYDCPMITDFLKAEGEICASNGSRNKK